MNRNMAKLFIIFIIFSINIQSKVKVDAATLRIAALATAVLLLLLSSGVASTATITVDDSGGAKYKEHTSGGG